MVTQSEVRIGLDTTKQVFKTRLSKEQSELFMKLVFTIEGAKKKGIEGFSDEVAWVPDDADESIPFPIRVLAKRVRALKLRHEITWGGYMFLSTLTTNPGEVMYFLTLISERFEKEKAERWLVSLHYLSSEVFPIGYWSREQSVKWWDSQKDDEGNNRVD